MDPPSAADWNAATRCAALALRWDVALQLLQRLAASAQADARRHRGTGRIRWLLKSVDLNMPTWIYIYISIYIYIISIYIYIGSPCGD